VNVSATVAVANIVRPANHKSRYVNHQDNLHQSELDLLEGILPFETEEWEQRIAAHNLTVLEASGDFVDMVMDSYVDDNSATS
jgi:hypothetical protein